MLKIAANRVFDGEKFLDNRVVHIDGRIARVETEKSTGGFLMPGFVDSHVHLLGVGLSLQALRLGGCSSQRDFEEMVNKYIHSFNGSWIVGRGWDQNKMGFMPDRHILDKLCPDRPVVLNRTCGHVLVANTKALDAAGVNASTQVKGGVIKRDASGQATGILEEKAMELVYRVVPPHEPAILYSALQEAIKYAHSWGITGVQTDDRTMVGSYSDLWELYTSVTRTNPIRAQLHYGIGGVEDLKEFIRVRKELKATDYVYPGAAKLFLDGSLGARTAAMLEDYQDDPGNKGVLVYEDELVKEIVSLAEANDVQLALHAIGDAAIQQAIDAVKDCRRGFKPGISHRIIHCQVTTKPQIERMAALGMTAEIQPVFLQTDMHWAASRLGPNRLQTSYCWRTMMELGLKMVGGSDAPVEDINPWPGVRSAVTRKDAEGNYASDWTKDESLTLEESLQLYTQAPARLANWNFGQIKEGVPADLALYESLNLEDLGSNKPTMLIINGEIIY